MPRRHHGLDTDPNQAEKDQRAVAARVAANVRRVRRDQALTQEQLAERVGCGTTYVQGIERGVENFTARMLGAIARGLQVDVVELLAPELGPAPAASLPAAPTRAIAANAKKRPSKPRR